MFLCKAAKFPAVVPSHLPGHPLDLNHLARCLHEIDLDLPLPASLCIKVGWFVVVRPEPEREAVDLKCRNPTHPNYSSLSDICNR